MTTRNLMEIFVLMRNNANHDRNLFSEQSVNDRMALVESGEMMELNKTILPPTWIGVLEEAQFQISRIRKKIDDLSRQQQGYLSKPTLDESNEREALIENLTQEITKLFGVSQKMIHHIEEQSRNCECNQEVKLSRNVTTSLCTTLQNLSIQFRHIQSSYLHSLKSRERRANLFFTNDEDDDYEVSDTLQEWSEKEVDVDRIFQLGSKYSEHQKQQILFEEDNAKLAQQRKQEVNHIVSSIADLNYIFKDLGRMITEQGTVLDRIDYNIEQTQTQVRRAYQELSKADRYQRKNRKIQCILILGPATIILFLLLIVAKL